MPTPRQQIQALQAQVQAVQATLDSTRSALANTEQEWRTTAEERDRYAASLIQTQASLVDTQAKLDAERSKTPEPYDAQPLISAQAEIRRLEIAHWTARGALRIAIAKDGNPMDVTEDQIEAIEQRWLEITKQEEPSISNSSTKDGSQASAHQILKP